MLFKIKMEVKNIKAEEIHISQHALKRFQEIWERLYREKLEYPEKVKVLRDCFTQAEEVRKTSLASLKDEIKYRKRRKYFLYGKILIFVTDWKVTNIITVCLREWYNGWSKVSRHKGGRFPQT